MKKTAIILALAFCYAAPAQAQEFPSWPASATCASAEVNCAMYERHARGQTSGVWTSLPPDIREQCIRETEEIQPSYRILYDCLATEMQRLAKQTLPSDQN